MLKFIGITAACVAGAALAIAARELLAMFGISW